MIAIEQIKAARALLALSQDELSRACGVSKNAINNIERRVASPRRETLEAIQGALEDGGVEFTDGPGVKLRGKVLRTQVFEGGDSVFRLFGDIIETLRNSNYELLASGINEREKLRADEKHFDDFVKKCTRHRIKSRVLVKEGERFFIDGMKHYRGVAEEIYGMVPYFIYGDKYAVLLWETPVRVMIIENKALASAYRKQFMMFWSAAKSQSA